MAIPETQLDTWSGQGSVAQSSETYATIRRALDTAEAPYADKQYRIFLQGSYGNDTNIYSESDVDVVIQLDSSFAHDLSELPQDQTNEFKAAYSDATYAHSAFKADVLKQLRGRFGGAVTESQKAVKIQAGAGRRSADVLIAVQFRRYHRFRSIDDQEYDEGICFWTASGTRVANYPRQHSTNCTSKHQLTSGVFKPMSE